MKVQLGLLLSFLTITTVLAQITSAYPDPDRHERNRCRPPSCTPQQRESGKKISEKDEIPVEGNSLDQSSTTENSRNVTDGNDAKLENIKTEKATEKSEPRPSPTTEKTEIVSQNVISSTTPSIENATEKPEPTPSPSPTTEKTEIVSENVISSTTPVTEKATEKSEPSPSPSPTPENTEVVSQNVISSTTAITEAANVTERNPTKPEEPIQVLSETSTDAPTEVMENSTEIRIPVEVKIIPPSRDELGGLTGHCPKSFRYHNETGMCFTPGEGKEHPCGALMQFNEQPGSAVYGQCDCKQYDGCDYRPLLYYPEAKRCFHIFDQGPCKSDEWLILGEKSYEATCTKRTCPTNEKNENGKTWFTLNGECHKLSTTAFCKFPLQTAQYELGKLVPTCSLTLLRSTSISCLAINVPKTITLGAVNLPCGPGKKSTGSGSCGSIIGF